MVFYQNVIYAATVLALIPHWQYIFMTYFKRYVPDPRQSPLAHNPRMESTLYAGLSNKDKFANTKHMYDEGMILGADGGHIFDNDWVYVIPYDCFSRIDYFHGMSASGHAIAQLDWCTQMQP